MGSETAESRATICGTRRCASWVINGGDYGNRKWRFGSTGSDLWHRVESEMGHKWWWLAESKTKIGFYWHRPVGFGEWESGGGIPVSLSAKLAPVARLKGRRWGSLVRLSAGLPHRALIPCPHGNGSELVMSRCVCLRLGSNVSFWGSFCQFPHLFLQLP